MGLNGYQRWNCTLFRYGTVIRDRTELYLVMAQLPEMGTPKILSRWAYTIPAQQQIQEEVKN